MTRRTRCHYIWMTSSLLEQNVELLKHKFIETFNIKDLGEINHYQGVKFTRSQSGIQIDQNTNAKSVVKGFERYLTLNLVKKYSTPMEREFKIKKRL